MTRPSVPQAMAWHPEALTDLGAEWDAAAGRLQAHADTVEGALRPTGWTGAAARAAGEAISPAIDELRQMCRALVIAAAEARDAALTVGQARDRVLTVLTEARQGGCAVADDGTVSAPNTAPELLVACSGGSPRAASALLEVRAAELTSRLQDALTRLGDADRESARAIDAAFGIAPESEAVRPAGTAEPAVADWPALSQDRIAGQIAAMSPEERERLIQQRPQQVGQHRRDSVGDADRGQPDQHRRPRSWASGEPWTARSRTNCAPPSRRP